MGNSAAMFRGKKVVEQRERRASGAAAEFPYLGHTVTYNNSNWAALYQNLWKAQRWWEMVGKVVMKTGGKVRARVMLYRAIVQSVLLYGRKSWVVMGDMLKVLEGLHHWAPNVSWKSTTRS